MEVYHIIQSYYKIGDSFDLAELLHHGFNQKKFLSDTVIRKLLQTAELGKIYVLYKVRKSKRIVPFYRSYVYTFLFSDISLKSELASRRNHPAKFQTDQTELCCL